MKKETMQDLWNSPDMLGPREALAASKAKRAARLQRWVEAQKAQKA